MSVRTNNPGWMHRVWYLFGIIGAGKLGNQAGAEGYGMKPDPLWNLGRVNGELVLMGRNQAMKMLIQAPSAGPQDRLKTGRR